MLTDETYPHKNTEFIQIDNTANRNDTDNYNNSFETNNTAKRENIDFTTFDWSQAAKDCVRF